MPKRVLFPSDFVPKRNIKRGLTAEFREILYQISREHFSAGNISREQKGEFWKLLTETLKAYSGSSRRPIDERFVSTRSCR